VLSHPKGVRVRNPLSLMLFGILLPCTAMAEQFTLVCHLTSPGVPPIDRNLLIDLDQSTVNGRPASISDSTITWQATTSNGRFFATRINRLTGAIEVTDSEFGIIWTGNCEKATQRKF